MIAPAPIREPPDDAERKQHDAVTRRLVLGGALCLSLPTLLIVGGLWLQFFGAWIELGHRPRALVDDPAALGWSTHLILLAAPGVLGALPGILLGVAFTAVGLAGGGWRSPSARWAAVWCAAAAAALALFSWDPLNIIAWSFG